jgi:hypothetical protein
MKVLNETYSSLDLLGELSVKISDPEERLRVRQAIGQSVGLLQTEIERPVVRTFPELDPLNKQES